MGQDPEQLPNSTRPSQNCLTSAAEQSQEELATQGANFCCGKEKGVGRRDVCRTSAKPNLQEPEGDDVEH